LAVSERGAWRDWLLFFLHGVSEQARDAARRARRLQDLQREWRQQVTRARSSALLLRLVDSLFETPVLTIPQAERLLGVAYRSAKLNVEKLVQLRILEQVGDAAYGKTFVAKDVLAAIAEGDE
jgi:Fic family protein